MTDINNSVMPGIIVMVYDVPSRNTNKKMPILDMEVWTDADGNIMFQHHEKPTSSKTVMHGKSSQSIKCRRYGVDCLTVLQYPMLDWKICVAPVLSSYMARMMYCGYPEKYRRDTLTRALRIYDKMIEDENNGTRPLYRPKHWNIIDRRNEKQKKKYEWSARGDILPLSLFHPTLTVSLRSH